MAKRASHAQSAFRIQLTNSAKSRVANVTDRIGITQIALTSKLAEWFAKQPEPVQAAVLGLYPKEIAPDVARLILKRMARSK